jgi:hypothetical protein
VEEELNQRPCHNLDSDVCVEQEEILGPVLLCMQVIFFFLRLLLLSESFGNLLENG